MVDLHWATSSELWSSHVAFELLGPALLLLGYASIGFLVVLLARAGASELCQVARRSGVSERARGGLLQRRSAGADSSARIPRGSPAPLAQSR